MLRETKLSKLLFKFLFTTLFCKLFTDKNTYPERITGNSFSLLKDLETQKKVTFFSISFIFYTGRCQICTSGQNCTKTLLHEQKVLHGLNFILNFILYFFVSVLVLLLPLLPLALTLGR